MGADSSSHIYEIDASSNIIYSNAGVSGESDGEGCWNRYSIFALCGILILKPS